MAEIEQLLKKKDNNIKEIIKSLKDIDDLQKKENLINKLAKLLQQKYSLINSLHYYKNVIEEDNSDNNNIIKEAIIDGHNLSMDLKSMKLFSHQMEKSICKITKSKTLKGTGFICKITKESKTYQVLITSNHILDINDIKAGKIIDISFNENGKLKNKILKINKLRKVYTNKNYDVTIIEIKKNDNFNENDMLTIDENIYSNNFNSYYLNKNIYIIHYPKDDLRPGGDCT